MMIFHSKILYWIWLYVGGFFELLYRLGAAGFDLDKAEKRLDEDRVILMKQAWRLKQGKK